MLTSYNILNKAYTSIITKLVDLIPVDPRGAKDSKPIQHYLDKIFYVFDTGIPWRKLPLNEDDLHYSSYHHKFMFLVKHRIFEIAYHSVIKILRKKRILNRNNLKHLFIDSTMIKNIYGKDSYGPNHYDRSKNGNKITIIVNHLGIPLGLSISKSNVNDTLQVLPTIDNISVKVAHSKLYADKGYISSTLSKQLKEDYKIILVVPRKKNQKNYTPLTDDDKSGLKMRNIVENFFAWFKSQRKVRLRYDAYISSYTQFSYLALIKIISLKYKNI